MESTELFTIEELQSMLDSDIYTELCHKLVQTALHALDQWYWIELDGKYALLDRNGLILRYSTIEQASKTTAEYLTQLHSRNGYAYIKRGDDIVATVGDAPKDETT